jgi:hypothetical protein
MGKMVRGRSNGLEAGGRAVSSTLAALVAVLIIVAGAVLSLVMLAYFTSVAVQGADVERLAQKSRETVKLAIGYEEVKDEEGVKYLTKMQLKNAWSGTTEITYAVVLDRQGRVMYEREFNPPLTLYASEVKFMKPSELVPELAPYDGDWWRMRDEVGLIVLHTRLGNRFTSFYEAPGRPVIVLQSPTSDITYILVYLVTTETTRPSTTTVTVVATMKIYLTTEIEGGPITVTETTFVSGGGGTVGTVCIISSTSTGTTHVVDPDLISTTTVTIRGGTYTSTKTEYLAAPTVTVTSTVTSTSTTTSYTTKTAEEVTTLTTMFWGIIVLAARGLLEALRPEIPILFGSIILLGAPDRFYKYIGRNWRRTMAILVVLTLAAGYLVGMGIGVEVAGAVTLTSTSTVTITFYSPIITTTTTSVQLAYITKTFKRPATIETVTVTVVTGGGAGGGGVSTVCTSTSTVYAAGSTVTVYASGTTTVTTYISPTTVYTTVTQTAGSFREVVATVTTWTTTTKTSTMTTTVTYYPCAFFIGLDPCRFVVGVY